MTNEELLARIDEDEKFLEQYFGAKFKGQSALRAVVGLHKPMPGQFEEGAISCFECSTMDYDVYWDECPTIKAIEGVLND